jgi:hypothetical protein
MYPFCKATLTALGDHILDLTWRLPAFSGAMSGGQQLKQAVHAKGHAGPPTRSTEPACEAQMWHRTAHETTAVCHATAALPSSPDAPVATSEAPSQSRCGSSSSSGPRSSRSAAASVASTMPAPTDPVAALALPGHNPAAIWSKRRVICGRGNLQHARCQKHDARSHS